VRREAIDDLDQVVIDEHPARSVLGSTLVVGLVHDEGPAASPADECLPGADRVAVDNDLTPAAAFGADELAVACAQRELAVACAQRDLMVGQADDDEDLPGASIGKP
jgi:hypothetical protein